LLLPLRVLAFPDPSPDLRLLGMAAFTVGTMGPGVMLAYAQRVLDPPGWRRLWQLPSIMVIGVGVALSTSLAVLEGLVSRRREFVRTPKFGLAGRGGSWRDKGYRQGAPWEGVAELALGAYCAAAGWTLWVDGEHAVLPFVVLYTVGFAAVGGLTIAQGLTMTRSTTRTWLPGLAAAARRFGRIAMLVLLVAGAIPGEAREADPWVALTRQGEALWARSPEPDNPVACATCHHGADAIRGWAASFPKFRPLPPPHARVMTLLQANAEAVALHYPHADRRASAVALSAYLTALGAGELVSPGRARGQPVLEERLAALARSRGRGERDFQQDCQRCHSPEDVAGRVITAARFARTGSGAVEIFLETHGGLRWRWEGPEVADLLAYLVEWNTGRPLEISAR
jgi:mono/diheme cytochrome c family protein